MAKRKNRKKSSRWKIALVLLFAISFLCLYICKNGYENIEIPSFNKSESINRSLKQVIKDADKIKNEIVSQAEKAEKNIRPVIDEFKEKSREKFKRENINGNSTGSSSELPHTGLEIPQCINGGDKGIILKRTGYTLSYNEYYKNPNWVAWELTREETKGKVDRYDKFLPDPDLPSPKVVHSDYTRSGYDRGHMAPAADFKWNTEAMKESFYMSNICPQTGNLNRGDWNDLEEVCREWAAKYGTVYIACGPIFDTKSPKRIGKNKVGIPDRFFKVVLIYNRKNPMGMGFLFNNKSHSQDLKKYMVTIDSIESITGLDFFSKLPDSVENRIEAEIPAIL